MKYIFLSLLIVSALVLPGFVRAESIPLDERTTVRGTIEDQAGERVEGANVRVTCSHNGSENTLDTTSDAIGRYKVIFTIAQCDDGDAVRVIAHKDGQSGDETDTIAYGRALVYVVLDQVVSVPEFGLITGLISIAMSGASYLAIKKIRS